MKAPDLAVSLRVEGPGAAATAAALAALLDGRLSAVEEKIGVLDARLAALGARVARLETK